MSVSGLGRPQRHVAREIITQAALLGLHHAPALHYTQGSDRWEGIAKHRVAAKGDYPRHADCSAFATWCLWNALQLRFHLGDIVNGTHWTGGYTGTMAKGGREVLHLKNVLRGDCVLYGPAPTYEHVAIIVGHQNGVPMVVSNGSESGPFLVRYDYRPDHAQIRRYI